jgi:hypothetical protein
LMGTPYHSKNARGDVDLRDHTRLTIEDLGGFGSSSLSPFWRVHWHYNDQWSFVDAGHWIRLGGDQTAICSRIGNNKDFLCDVYGPPPEEEWVDG